MALTSDSRTPLVVAAYHEAVNARYGVGDHPHKEPSVDNIAFCVRLKALSAAKTSPITAKYPRSEAALLRKALKLSFRGGGAWQIKSTIASLVDEAVGKAQSNVGHG